jgi:hypothetical protein
MVDALTRVAPWPVTFVDSSDAIARRALSFASVSPAANIAYVTAATDIARYRDVFTAEGFETTQLLTLL